MGAQCKHEHISTIGGICKIISRQHRENSPPGVIKLSKVDVNVFFFVGFLHPASLRRVENGAYTPKRGM